MASVKLTNVKKIYGKNTVAVQDFNLEIADKEFIVFVCTLLPSRTDGQNIRICFSRKGDNYSS